MKITYVTLEVRDDDEARHWWDALCLPAPERWNVSVGAVFAPGVYASEVLSVEGSRA